MIRTKIVLELGTGLTCLVSLEHAFLSRGDAIAVVTGSN